MTYVMRLVWSTPSSSPTFQDTAPDASPDTAHVWKAKAPFRNGQRWLRM